MYHSLQQDIWWSQASFKKLKTEIIFCVFYSVMKLETNKRGKSEKFRKCRIKQNTPEQPIDQGEIKEKSERILKQRKTKKQYTKIYEMPQKQL